MGKESLGEEYKVGFKDGFQKARQIDQEVLDNFKIRLKEADEALTESGGVKAERYRKRYKLEHKIQKSQSSNDSEGDKGWTALGGRSKESPKVCMDSNKVLFEGF